MGLEGLNKVVEFYWDEGTKKIAISWGTEKEYRDRGIEFSL